MMNRHHCFVSGVLGADDCLPGETVDGILDQCIEYLNAGTFGCRSVRNVNRELRVLLAVALD